MMLKVISRIVQIKDRGGVASSEICIILQITRKPNAIIFYYSFKKILTLNHAYLH